jgi:hypothetical protein
MAEIRGNAETVTNEMKEQMPPIKVVRWHKEIKAEGQLEKESRRFHPYPPQGWREQRKKQILGEDSSKKLERIRLDE